METFLLRQSLNCQVFCLVLLFWTRASLVKGETMISQEHSNEHTTTLTAQQEDQFAQNSARFAVDLYGLIKQAVPNKNIIFSPFSVQTCIALARVGAEGETAHELDQGLRLISSDPPTIVESFSNLLREFQNSDYLKIANGIFVADGFNLRKEFKQIASNKFFASADVVNFGNSVQAAATINNWVASQTNNLVKDLVVERSLSADTRLMLLNAIYFKGQWLHEFDKTKTRNKEFYLNEQDSVEVPMMYVEERFLYADLPNLDATALEMPYKDSNISMLVILPNSRTGLPELHNKLKNTSLSDVTSKLYRSKVNVHFPKFKTEFSIQLKEPMEKLGMRSLFSDKAEFSKMLEEDDRVQVNSVLHKAFIEVNEEGAEAAASTAVHVRTKRALNSAPQSREFIADHPFLYAIHHSSKSSSVADDANASRKVTLFVGSLSTQIAHNKSSVQRDEL